jgi:glycosyltransferase involved in cell wall biosynthesis
MTEQPLVSVIMIFLNPGKFLQEAVSSVFAQTYPHWELIFIDDGSTDGSSVIARSLAGELPERIRYHDHPGHRNLGMSLSRNLGMRIAAGELIAMLDADDVWFPRKLDQQITVLRAHPEAALVYGRTLQWRSWRKGPRLWIKDTISHLGLTPDRLYGSPELLEKLVRARILSPSMSSVCFRRELFDRTGGFEGSFRGMYEDQVFMTKVFLRETVFPSSQVWDKYRLHPDSCVASSKKRGLSSVARDTYLKWVEEYLRSQNLKDVVTNRVVKKTLWNLRHPTVTRICGTLQDISGRGWRLLSMLISVRGWNGRRRSTSL